MRNVLITGYKGFVGQNLVNALKGDLSYHLMLFGKDDSGELLKEYLRKSDFIFHLAGINRPQNSNEYFEGNYGLTKEIIDTLLKLDQPKKIIFSSSTQAILDNPYGQSKLLAEKEILKYHELTGADVHIFRLTNIFGKGIKPNYNSVVATFAYNISHGLEITVNDPEKILTLVHIDDVISEFMKVLDGKAETGYCEVKKNYKITLKDLADCFYDIKNNIQNPNEIYDLLKEIYYFYL